MKLWTPKHGPRKYAHLKYDGHSIVVKKLNDNVVKYYTRNMREVDLSFLHTHDAIARNVPVGMTLHAELWKRGEPASYVSSGIARRDHAMLLSVFSLPNHEPYAGLELAYDLCNEWRLNFIPWLVYVATDLNTKHPGCAGSFYDPAKLAIPEHCEGYVLKSCQGDLEPLKIKAELTADLIVTGYTEGKGKYIGLVGSLEGSLFGQNSCADVGGFTDSERRIITDLLRHNQLLYRVMEVKYQYVGAGGRLRHPRFVRWREDKSMSECLELT